MKKIAVLAAVFLGLAAFVYFYEIAGREEREKADELQESVLRQERDDVDSLVIRVKEKDPVSLAREGDRWMLKEPISGAADSSTVQSFLSSLANAKRDRTFDEEGLDLSAYGLDDPAVEIEIGTADSRRSLLVGARDFSGSQVYVKFADSGEVLLTSTSVLTSADKTLFDWRNKRALTFDRDQVEEVEVVRPDGPLRLVRREGKWHLSAPVEDAGDTSAISDLLSSLDQARVREFIEEHPESLSEYGLDQPDLTVRIREQGSDSWKELRLGRADGEDRYARDPQRTPVFTLGSDLAEKLTQEVWAFRDKDIVDAGQTSIARLTFRRTDESFSVTHEDYRWTFESPEELAGQEALSYKFWYPLDDLRFASIVDRGDLPEADVEIELELTDGTRQHYGFAQLESEFLAWKGEGSRVGTISEEDFTKLVTMRAAELTDQPAESLGESEE